MAPVVPKFPVESLPDHVNIVSHSNFQEKRRKPPVDLKQCSLHEMTQYSCNPPDEGVPQPGVIVCKPLVRLFRRYGCLLNSMYALADGSDAPAR